VNELLDVKPDKTENLPQISGNRPQLTTEEETGLKALLFGALTLDIDRLIQRNLVNAEYELVVRDGRSVLFHSVREFRNQRTFADRVYEALQLQIPTYKDLQWQKILNALAKLIIVEQNWSPKEMVLEWVQEFVEPCVEVENISNLSPDDIDRLRCGGLRERGTRRVAFKLRRLYSAITANRNAKIDERGLANYLRMAGFEQVDNIASTGGKSRKLSGKIWRGALPQEEV
jgi:hypothetical protein